MKKKLELLILVAVLFGSVFGKADDDDSLVPILSDENLSLWGKVENMDDQTPIHYYRAKIEFGLKYRFDESVSILFEGKFLEKFIVGDEEPGCAKFDCNEFIKRAFLELRHFGEIPMTWYIGRLPAPFGQQVSTSSNSYNDLTHYPGRNDYATGVRLDLENAVFDASRVEVMVFESGEDLDSLKGGSVDSLAIRFTKEMSENSALSVSGLHRGNSGLYINSDNEVSLEQKAGFEKKKAENRASIGMVYQNSKWTGYIEGLYFENDTRAPVGAVEDSKQQSLSLGGDYRWGGFRFAGWHSEIFDSVRENGVAIHLEHLKRKGLTLGFDLRGRKYVAEDPIQNQVNGNIFGWTITWQMESP